MPDIPPILAAIADTQREERISKYLRKLEDLESQIPASMRDWSVDLEHTGHQLRLYRRNPNLATLPNRSFYAALDDARLIAAYYELLPPDELEPYYTNRLAFRPPWHTKDGKLCNG